MKKLFVLVAVAVLLLAASCDSKNDGGGWPELNPSNITITVPTGMTGGVDADWSVSWTSNKTPFTVVWSFGGGADPNTVTATATGNSSDTTVNMINDSITDDATYTVSVTITDTDGGIGTTSTSYTVGHMLNQNPTIDSAVFDATTKVLTVTASDPDDDQTLTVAVTEPDGLSVDATSKTASATGPLTATFTWSADSLFDGGSGTTTITVTDQDSGSATTTAAISISGTVLASDTIYAIPMVSSAATTDIVTVLVATGTTPEPFLFLTGANVTCPTWVSYAEDSYNIGAIGGETDDVDGIWADMGVSSFMVGPDSFIFGQENEDIAVTGRHRIPLYVTPMDGTQTTTASGELCNFGVTFDQAGTASFGFVQTTGTINRTYYVDVDENVHYWGTLMAGPDGVLNVTGVSNEIVVN